MNQFSNCWRVRQIHQLRNLAVGLIAIPVLMSVGTAYAGVDKVDVCHITDTVDFGSGVDVPVGHVILIADPAYPAHLAHGDPEAYKFIYDAAGNEYCTAQVEEPLGKFVFVTSEPFGSDLGGLAGADEICQGLASAAWLDGTYKAWLSSDGLDVEERLTHSTVPYVRTDGVTIAEDWDDLTLRKWVSDLDYYYLQAPINLDQNGSTIAEGRMVWTGVSDLWGDYTNCNTWSGATEGITNTGVTESIKYWRGDGSNSSCYEMNHLYCFEQ